MKQLLLAAAALAITLLAGGIALWLMDVPPLAAYRDILLSCWSRWSDTLAETLVLSLLGVGVAFAFRAGFWNVGAEGQLCCGAVAAAGVGLFMAPASLWPTPWIWTAVALGAGFAAGALWCIGPAVLRARWQVNEVVTTLMLVYIAKRLLEYLYLGPWRDPKGYGFPGSAPLPESLHASLSLITLLAVASAVLCGLLATRSVLGFEMSILSQSWHVARYTGLRAGRCLSVVAVISGGLAGLAGAVQVTGTAGRLISGISVGDGFTAIIVACLAARHPLGVLLVAPLWAVLKVGSEELQVTYHLPVAFSTALEGLCLLSWLVGTWLAERLSRPGKGM